MSGCIQRLARPKREPLTIRRPVRSLARCEASISSLRAVEVPPSNRGSATNRMSKREQPPCEDKSSLTVFFDDRYALQAIQLQELVHAPLNGSLLRRGQPRIERLQSLPGKGDEFCIHGMLE